MAFYCDFAPEHPLHGPYHDTEYGFSVETDDELFERLVLEMNQAGLSWEGILKKRKSFRKAYNKFSIKKVAKYADEDIERLMNDEGVIRNKLKIQAAIHNAKRILELQAQFGSFHNWIEAQKCRTIDDWVSVFKKNSFKFVGAEIVREFLVSTGYVRGAHRERCPINDDIAHHRSKIRKPIKLKIQKL
jgi:DNA-3-methyladenine glycosylase I